MATDKPRFTITLPDEVYEEVSEYKEENGYKTQSKAIQQLIKLGLQDVGEEQEEAVSAKDKRLLEWFRSLPAEKQKAILISQDAPKDIL